MPGEFHWDRTGSILRSVARAFRRRQKSIQSLAANNLQYAALAFFFLGDPGAVVFFVALIGVVLILPMSADPLGMVPPMRLRTWPLGKSDLRALRIASPWLSPMTWILVALAFWKRIAFSLWAVLAAPVIVRWIVPPGLLRGAGVMWRRVPRLPGSFGMLVRKDLRQVLSTLDFWVAMMLAAPALAGRIAGLLPRESFVPLTLLLVLAISTCAQSLFGLDGQSGLTRYHLLPLRGWHVLASKDIAFVGATFVLCLPLSPLCGLSAALAGVAVGHASSVLHRREETRWRFQTSPSFGASATQMIAMAGAGSATVLWNPLVLAASLAACLASLWYVGQRLEQIEAGWLP
ncbi:MAG: hypothetical protein KGN84_19200 [Acidobacteriota bacterium]|nr:hypothetical protein [Acidobacteriota bacterium]